jgi:hypothetical protein
LLQWQEISQFLNKAYKTEFNIDAIILKNRQYETIYTINTNKTIISNIKQDIKNDHFYLYNDSYSLLDYKKSLIEINQILNKNNLKTLDFYE